MLRQIDLSLAAVAMVSGGAAAAVAVVRSRSRVGVIAVIGAVVSALAVDRWVVGGVPAPALGELGVVAGLGAVVLAVVVGRGAWRLPGEPVDRVPPVLWIVLASLVGVWAGVPETSAAIVAAGVGVGMAAVLALGRLRLSGPAAIAMSVLPVVAAYQGAAGNVHALVGGGLCVTTLVVLAVAAPRRTMAGWRWRGGLAVHLLAALVAARQIAVDRDWAGTPGWVAVVVGLAVAAVALFRSAQSDEEL